MPDPQLQEQAPPQAFEPAGQVLDISCRLAVELAVLRFTVDDLLRLKRGSVADTGWAVSEALPVCTNGERIAWAEFELVSDRLAVRLTELI